MQALPLIVIAALWLGTGCRASAALVAETLDALTLAAGWMILAAMYGWMCRTRSNPLHAVSLLGTRDSLPSSARSGHDSGPQKADIGVAIRCITYPRVPRVLWCEGPHT
jgi:hypothetical protein